MEAQTGGDDGHVAATSAVSCLEAQGGMGALGGKEQHLHGEPSPAGTLGQPLTGAGWHQTRQSSQRTARGWFGQRGQDSAPWLTHPRQISYVIWNQAARLPAASSPSPHLTEYVHCYLYQRALSQPSPSPL